MACRKALADGQAIAAVYFLLLYFFSLLQGFLSGWQCLRPRQCRIAIAGRSNIMIPQIYEMLIKDDGQDIAEYAVMLAVILVIVVGTIRLIGSNANNVFSAAASSIQ